MRIPILILAMAVATPSLAQEQPRAPKPTAPVTREQALAAHKERCRLIVQRVTGIGDRTNGRHGPGGFTNRPVRYEQAVNRTIDGCPVPVIVRYDVERRR